MNRITYYRWSFALAALRLLPLGSQAFGQPPATKPVEQEQQQTFPKRTFSEAHRFVFFAVLEGCYEDGLTKEAVDLIIPEVENGGRELSVNFVYACPLCCPAYNAFHVYASRPQFACGLKLRRYEPYNTFGEGLDEDVLRQLATPGLECRNAIQALIEKWVNARIERLRLTPEETKSLREELAAMRKEGEQMLKNWQQTPDAKLSQAYKDWKSCPICSGSSPMGGTSE